MSRRLIKNFIFGFFLLFFLGVALFPKQILLKCIAWQASHYCKRAFGAKLLYDSVDWKGNAIVLTAGRVQKENELAVTFERATLVPSFDLKHRTISATLDLKLLKIIHRKKEQRLILNFPTSGFKLFRLNLDTTIEQGEAFLYDFQSENQFFQRVLFDLNHHVFNEQTCGSIDFRLHSKTPNLIAHFCKQKDGRLELKAQFRQQSFPDFAHLMTYFLQTYLPEPAFHWDILQGTIDGNIKLTFVNGEPSLLRGRAELQNVQGKNAPLKLLAQIKSLECDLDIDFSEISAINGKLDLNGGKISLHEDTHFWEGIWDFNNLNSYVIIKEGKVETSSLKGDFMGMEAEMVFDWYAPEVLMQIAFQGVSKDMLELLPGKIKERFSIAFPEDLFKLDAKLKRSSEGLELNGTLAISDPESSAYQINFGCLLGNNKEIDFAVPKNINFSLSSSVHVFLENLKHQFCLSQKYFGWIRGKNIPLEKFLSPFLLHGLSMKISGLTDFKGTFDERYLVVSYEGKDFTLESPQFFFHVDTISEKMESGAIAAHYFDLKTREHVGFLPFKEGKYWQKNYNFHLEKVNAIVHFENEKIHIRNIETQSEGLSFGGNVAVAIQALDDIDLKINVDKLSGSTIDAQKFLSHFKTSFFWQLPLEGKILGEEQSLFFHYHFDPLAQLLEGHIQGELYLNNSYPFGSLQDFRGFLEYDHLRNELRVNNCSGKILLPKQSSPLTIHEMTISIQEFPDALLNFYCQLKEGSDFVLALKGVTQKTDLGKEFIILGQNSTEEEKIYIKSIQSGQHFEIVDFVWDEWTGNANLYCDEKFVHIPHLSFTGGEKLNFLFSGDYDFNAKTLQGEIKRFGCNLSVPFGKSFASWNPLGEVEGSGSLVWHIGHLFEANTQVSFHNLGFGGIYFGGGDNLLCNYSSETGFSIEGLEIEIPSDKKPEKYQLGRLHYDLKKHTLALEEFDFSLPEEKLTWVAKTAERLFPGKFQTTMLDWIEALKHNEPLEGRFSLEKNPDNICICLSLKDGLYRISDQEFDLKNFHLIYDSQKLNLWSECLYRDNYYWVNLTTHSSSMSEGVLKLSQTREGSDALVISWVRESAKGFSLKKVEGVFCGMDISLENQASEILPSICLQGRLRFDTVKIQPLLSPYWKNFIDKLAILGVITLEGTFNIPKSHLLESSFLGHISSKECKIKNIIFDAISADLDYQKNRIKFTDFIIKDWAGRFYINTALLNRDQEAVWHIACDEICVDNLRLSRLKSPWTKWTSKDKPFFRSLFIPAFILENLTGKLNDMNSFSGLGKIEFTNLTKKTLFSNLLFVPTEITARIGLDLTALIPVRGTIEYSIQDGKINFKEFKDMFSDGKRSRFYLAENTEAFVDFKGNLNMKIKMKQYNLLMKLAEFFTISVKGTILHPSYSFSSQDDEASF